MGGTEQYDVAIAGTGPAALLAGMILARDGWRVALLGYDDRPAPQGAHVHLFDDDMWPRMSALVPKLNADLRAAGIAFLPEVTRRTLEKVLHCSVRRHACDLRIGRFRIAEFAGGRWQVQTSDGDELHASWLIDATGTARVTARSVSDELGVPLSLDEAEAKFCYTTWRLNGVSLPQGRAGHRWLSPQDGTAVLLARDGNGSALLTLQRLGSPAEVLPGSPFELLDELGDHPLTRACASASVIAPPSRWAGSAITRIGLETVAAAKLPWLALGDSLVTTPPVLGSGFEQIIEQSEVIARTSATGELPPAHAPLDELSQRRFHQAILGTVRRGGLLPSVPAEFAQPPISRSHHANSSA